MYPFLLGNCMTRYYYKAKVYAEYGKLTIIGGTKKLERHLQIPKLLIRRTGNYLCVTYSEEQALVESTIYMLTSDSINLKFLLGILNSKMMTFYLQQKLMTNAQGFPQILMGQLDQLPIIKQSKSTEKSEQKIVHLVDKILLQKTTNKPDTSALESEIDALVYALYGLTSAEIAVIEGA